MNNDIKIVRKMVTKGSTNNIKVRGKIMALIVEYFDHKSYARKFKYGK